MTRRKGPRSRQETEQDRRHQDQQTAQEIDQLVAEFHQQLPRDQAKSIGAIYARYSSRFQHSITDQVRSLLAKAVDEGIFIPHEHICFDQGVRGSRESRTGLQQLRSLLAAGAENPDTKPELGEPESLQMTTRLKTLTPDPAPSQPGEAG